jgi:signal transduction histidine kinase
MEELTALLITPAGAFFHQLTITLILFGTIIVAIGRNAPETKFPAGRMLLGLSVLLVFRLALSVAAIIQVSSGESTSVQDILESGFSTASAAILVWLWVFPQRTRTADAATLLLTTFILALTVTGVGAALQAVSTPAGTWLTGAALWKVLTIALCLIGALLLLRLRPPVWGYGVSMLVVLAAGETAGLLIGEPAAAVTGIMRLAQIAALPVLLTLPQRILPPQPETPAPAPPAVRSAPERKRVNLPPSIFENFLNLALEKDLLSICRYTSEVVSFSLVADICLVLSRPTATDEIIIFCGYDQVLEQEIGGAQIAARHLPMIASSIQKHAPLRLPASSASSDLKFLSSSLRLPKSGHLLVAPIRTRQPSDLGALVLLTPYSSRTWTQDDQAFLAQAAEAFSRILDQVRTRAEHEDVLRGVERELEETRAREQKMLAEIHAARNPGPETGEPDQAMYANVLAAMEAEAADRQVMEEELQELRDDRTRLAAELADQNWDQTVQHLQAENIQLQLAVDELESDLEDLHTRSEGLKLAREETLAIVEKLTAENRALAEELESAAGKAVRSSENGNPAANERSHADEELRAALTEIAHLRNSVGEAEIKIVELENLASAGANITQQWESIIGLAEEMRQPMSSILGYSDFLLTESVGLLGALQRKFLERVKSSTNRMSTMVEDLIHIAAAESGKLKLSLGKVDLNSLIDSAVASTSVQIREKKIALLVNLPDELPMIEGDREAIRLTLVHLLQNAAAATPTQGEISIEIKLESEEETVRFVRITVRDSGSGISPKDIETVFDRAARSRDRLVPGLGVSGSGLSIARTLVEAHGGRIWVESGPQPGTTFSVLLPVTQDISETLFGNRGL